MNGKTSDNLPCFDSIIIGAGLSGCLMAKKLMQRGHNVCVLEKSRGTGGRSGSKRISSELSEMSLNVDLGATSVCLDHPDLVSLRDELLEHAIISPWSSSISDSKNSFVGTPKASAITRYLLGDATLITSTKAHHIEKSGKEWLVRDDAYKPVGRCENLIISAPPSQTAMLLATIEGAAAQLLVAHAAAANTRPQWAMWLETPKPLNEFNDHNESDVIHRLTLETSKPGRSDPKSDIWVIQSTPEWASLHIDHPKDWIAEALIAEFKRVTQHNNHSLETIQFGQPHRWFLGRQTNVANKTDKTWNADLKLGIAGDWLHSGDAQGAMLSGLYLVNQMG
ncbi:NAD(P)/FAD-dependent oxidoreductase [Marinomonas mediterranea]|uniref:NAD(P)/FAD-dependent oxidoreductase n=1 Tax=Marinomonas mediterranea TaxID=119864 RepID=UPI00234ADDBE|nr:NAD(P)-binding protein [Marinomonas mediterranea]